MNRHLGFLTKTLIEALEQCAAAGQHDAAIMVCLAGSVWTIGVITHFATRAG